MKELRKVTEKIKKVLINAERGNEEFPWIVDKLSLIKMYDMGLPIQQFPKSISKFGIRDRIRADCVIGALNRW